MRARAAGAGAAVALLLALASCAPPAKPPQAPVPPSAESFPTPTPLAGEANEKEARDLAQAWQQLQRGEIARAEKTYRRLATRNPRLLTARTGLGHVHLAAGRLDAAAHEFETVLAARPDDVSALSGAASAAVRKGDLPAAVPLLQRAIQLRPQDAALRRRLSEARVQLTEKSVSAAREAAAGGDSAAAVAIYRQVIEEAPEVSDLRLELADLLLKGGDTAAALEVLAADPTGDRPILLRQGELLMGQQQYPQALEVYRRLLEKDPRDEEALRAARAARDQMELAQMPPEYRRIRGADSISRSDLAALIAVKVTALTRVPPGPAKVAVDISGSWAREHILRALSYDIMSVYPNHTFQPLATVRRGELALAVQRVLDLLHYPPAASPTFTDLPRSSLHHYAAARVVGAGLMEATGEQAFQAWRPVSGREASDVIDGLVRLVGP